MLFHLHDQVRLVTTHGDVRAGSLGRIIGWYRRLDPSGL